MTCPTEDQWLTWVHESRRATLGLEPHFDSCAECRELAVSLLRYTDEVEEERSFRHEAREGSERQLGKLGRYVLNKSLGAGGMGVVYKAYDPELDRTLAIKVLRQSSRADVSQHEQLKLEARALARLSHPNVISVLDVGQADGQLFVAMEFMPNGNLRTLCREEVPWRRKFQALSDAASGLEAAHVAGMIHRDFKPDNVLIAADGTARVCDFGLAQSASDATAQKQWVGTRAYTAPEVSQGAGFSAASDQYSFCVTAYEILYGVRPTFEKEHSGLKSRWSKNLPPKAVERVLQRGLQEDSSDRYASMKDLRRALTQAVQRDQLKKAMLFGTIAASFLLATASFFVVKKQNECRSRSARLSEVFSPERRARLKEQFLATRLPIASSTYGVVEHHLNRFLKNWEETTYHVCGSFALATESKKTFDAEAYACLDALGLRFQSVVQALKNVDVNTVRRGASVAEDLFAPSRCLDQNYLRASLPASQTLDETRKNFEKVRAECRSGLCADGMQKVTTLAATFPSLTSPQFGPLSAEAHILLAQLAIRKEGTHSGEKAIFQAIASAESVGRDDLISTAASMYAYALAGESKLESSMAWESIARAANLRIAGALPQALIGVEMAAGLRAFVKNEFELAERHFRLALQHARAAYEADDAKIARVLNNLALALHSQRKFDDAFNIYVEAEKIFSLAFGPQHPDVAIPIVNSAAVLRDKMDFEKSITRYQKALEIQTNASSAASSLEQARLQASMLPAWVWLGRLEEAHAAARAAIPTMVTILGELNNEVRAVRLYDGLAFQRENEHRLAEEICSSELKSLEKETQLDTDLFALAAYCLGTSQKALHHHALAQQWFERALKNVTARTEDMLRASIQSALSECLVEQHRDLNRAKELHESARKTFERQK